MPKVKFNFIKETVDGNIFAKLINSEGKVLVEIEGEKIIKIEKTDTYKVQVEGKKHKGNFNLMWNVD